RVEKARAEHAPSKMVFSVISSSQKKNDEHSLCSGAFTHPQPKKVKRHPVLRRTWKNQAIDFM
ncbi:hypothetical protein, partial [Rhizobium oryzihabitans]|uniref:hypothetical protein n=1 Tax=Rhizobium oryzihabitans TaxID=2267833 RepID=UPI0040357209